MEGSDLTTEDRLSLIPMSSFFVLVIADPNAAYLKSLTELPDGVRLLVTDTPEELRTNAPSADAILYAHGKSELLSGILSLARRAQWIHSLWTGVEGILSPEMLAHPAPLTNGRGVFRWPLADWVVG